MALQHGGTAAIHFLFQRLNYVRMVVTDIVNAVAGEVIENTPPIGGKKLRSKAPVILHIHLQQVEECRPPGIDVSCIVRSGRNGYGSVGHTPPKMRLFVARMPIGRFSTSKMQNSYTRV